MVGSERLPIPPLKGGAVQTYVHEVSRRLADDYGVVTCSPGPVVDGHEGVERLELESEGYLTSLLEVVKRGRYDVVHIFNRPRFVPALAAAAASTPVVLNLHNEHLAELARQECLEVTAVTRSIVTNGEFLRHRVLDLVPSAAGRVVSIPSGVDIEIFNPRARITDDARGCGGVRPRPGPTRDVCGQARAGERSSPSAADPQAC